VNAKAKSRAARNAASGGAPLEPALPDREPAERPPLVAAEGIVDFEVGAGQAGERLDRFLGHAADERRLALSRTRLKALIEAGMVAVDGLETRDPAAKLAKGAKIAVVAPPAEESDVAGEDLPLDIVFEDDCLIVLNKPAGLVVHPAPGHSQGTLVNALIRHCGASLSGVGGVKRPGIVHRLDKDTSGLIVVAKTDAAHQGLAALFADHGRTGSLVREYRALVWGALEGKAGSVDAPLGRHSRHREKMAVVSATRGREAVTHWRLEEPLGPASLIACRLETGRTHQIRVHLAHIGHPLLGDSVYGAGFKTKASQLSDGARLALEALGRQALHAATLGFEHPITGEALSFASPPPDDFTRLVKALRETGDRRGG
jgi:23S rRNA pseudouridine1911/1915/1917 synthase